jgi:hypothetical protein
MKLDKKDNEVKLGKTIIRTISPLNSWIRFAINLSAMMVSFYFNKSVLWAIFHFFFGAFYLIYSLIIGRFSDGGFMEIINSYI